MPSGFEGRCLESLHYDSNRLESNKFLSINTQTIVLRNKFWVDETKRIFLYDVFLFVREIRIHVHPMDISNLEEFPRVYGDVVVWMGSIVIVLDSYERLVSFDILYRLVFSKLLSSIHQLLQE